MGSTVNAPSTWDHAVTVTSASDVGSANPPLSADSLEDKIYRVSPPLIQDKSFNEANAFNGVSTGVSNQSSTANPQLT